MRIQEIRAHRISGTLITSGIQKANKRSSSSYDRNGSFQHQEKKGVTRAEGRGQAYTNRQAQYEEMPRRMAGATENTQITLAGRRLTVQYVIGNGTRAFQSRHSGPDIYADRYIFS